MNQDI